MFLRAYKANLQPLTPLWNYWSLGPYKQRINKVLTSRAHPGMPINVMEAQVGENPEQPNALNCLQKRRPGWLIYFKIPP